MPLRPQRRVLFSVLICVALASCDEGVPLIVQPPEPPEPPAPTTVQVVAGAGQRAVQGLSLLDSIVVRILDQQGQTMAGQSISFAPEAGHGSADPAVVTTDANGHAATTWTLGADAGTQTLAITAAEATASVTAISLDLEAELDTIFMPATEAEIEAVRTDWAGRDVSAVGARVELAEQIDLLGPAADLRVVSHTVGGLRHYGAIIVPVGAAERSLPILAFLHGGDSGVSITDLVISSLALGEFRDDFAYVIPSFRSEPLEYGDSAWVSEGKSSHWDYDVDDLLALLNVAIETTPEAKPDSINLFGGSRGAGVALLAGVRDERIARVVAFFGPTFFFDDWVREIVREAAMRMPRRLTGVAHLDSTVVQPYVRGDLTRAEVRLELVRRSSVLFAADLPYVQLHHGTVDQTVDVSQARAMIAAMEALGRGAPDFEAFIYEGGGHELFGLGEAIPRAVAFLAQALGTGES